MSEQELASLLPWALSPLVLVLFFFSHTDLPAKLGKLMNSIHSFRWKWSGRRWPSSTSKTGNGCCWCCILPVFWVKWVVGFTVSQVYPLLNLFVIFFLGLLRIHFSSFEKQTNTIITYTAFFVGFCLFFCYLFIPLLSFYYCNIRLFLLLCINLI